MGIYLVELAPFASLRTAWRGTPARTAPLCSQAARALVPNCPTVSACHVPAALFAAVQTPAAAPSPQGRKRKASSIPDAAAAAAESPARKRTTAQHKHHHILHGNPREADEFWGADGGLGVGQNPLIWQAVLEGLQVTKAQGKHMLRNRAAMAMLLRWHMESGRLAKVELHEEALWSGLGNCVLAPYHGPGFLKLAAAYCAAASVLFGGGKPDGITAKRARLACRVAAQWYQRCNYPDSAAGAELLIHSCWMDLLEGKLALPELPELLVVSALAKGVLG